MNQQYQICISATLQNQRPSELKESLQSIWETCDNNQMKNILALRKRLYMFVRETMNTLNIWLKDWFATTIINFIHFCINRQASFNIANSLVHFKIWNFNFKST